jgi:hypothetical protein
VITADNPRGERLDPRDNAAPQQRLASSLRRLGVAAVPCDGCCPDAIHRERGFAAVLPLEQAMALAAEFGQSAIYWFDGESIWLVPVLEAAMPERLGGTSPRSPPESIG